MQIQSANSSPSSLLKSERFAHGLLEDSLRALGRHQRLLVPQPGLANALDTLWANEERHRKLVERREGEY